jgi:hypothetical protein
LHCTTDAPVITSGPSARSHVAAIRRTICEDPDQGSRIVN